MGVQMLRIYLDQWCWIHLARQHYGRTNDSKLADVLVLAEAALARGVVSFPLSSTHYIETFRQRDVGRRQRLSRFMARLSRMHSMLSAPYLLDAEIEKAYRERYGLPPAVSPQVFGVGAAHAFGRTEVAREINLRMDRIVERVGVPGFREAIERILLVGPDFELPAHGIQLPDKTALQNQLALELKTSSQIDELGHTADLARRVVLAQEFWAMSDQLNEIGVSLGFPPNDLLNGTTDNLLPFLKSMPAKWAITRMRMSGHENIDFKWKLTDLNDFAGLGTAAGYCDVVVAEKAWGSILQRNEGELNARVFRRPSDLIAVLASL